MICCVIAAAFIIKYVIGFRKIASFFGLHKPVGANPYGYEKYNELDSFRD